MGRIQHQPDKFALTGYSKPRLKEHFETVAQRAVQRILEQYPKVLAVVLDGSVGRRDPNPYSDIDLTAFVASKRIPKPIHYIDNCCYVGVYFFPLKAKKRSGMDFFWARGGATTARPLYDPRGALGKRIEADRTAKASRDVVEDTRLESYANIIEYAGKLRNGWLASDEYLSRYAARIIAVRAEEAVVALNDISPASENIVWHLVMKAKKRPAHFDIDYPLAVGLKGTARTRLVFEAGLRLARETLKLVRSEYTERASDKGFRSLVREPLEQIGL